MPIDQANSTGATSLMYASSSGKAEVLRELLALGADASLRTQDGFSALDMAANMACLNLLRPPRTRPGHATRRKSTHEPHRLF